MSNSEDTVQAQYAAQSPRIGHELIYELVRNAVREINDNSISIKPYFHHELKLSKIKTHHSRDKPNATF